MFEIPRNHPITCFKWYFNSMYIVFYSLLYVLTIRLSFVFFSGVADSYSGKILQTDYFSKHFPTERITIVSKISKNI